MPDKGEWIQLLIFVIFIGLGVGRWLFGAFWNRAHGKQPAARPPAKSPAIRMLEQLRAEGERAAGVQRTRDDTGRTDDRGIDRGLEKDHDDGSDDEDAFFGGDEPAFDDESDRSDSGATPRAGRDAARTGSFDLEWEDVDDAPAGPPRARRARPSGTSRQEGTRPASSPRTPPPPAVRTPRPSPAPTRRLDAEGSLVPADRVIHPRSETPRTTHVRADDEHVTVSDELELSHTTTDLGMSVISSAAAEREWSGARHAALASRGLDLRRLMIAHVVLGAPKALRGRRGPDVLPNVPER